MTQIKIENKIYNVVKEIKKNVEIIENNGTYFLLISKWNWNKKIHEFSLNTNENVFIKNIQNIIVL